MGYDLDVMQPQHVHDHDLNLLRLQQNGRIERKPQCILFQPQYY